MNRCEKCGTTWDAPVASCPNPSCGSDAPQSLLDFIGEAFMATPQFASPERFDAWREIKSRLSEIATKQSSGEPETVPGAQNSDVAHPSPTPPAVPCVVEKLQEENFALAAGQCLHGIKGDEGGTPYCPRIRELEAENQRFRNGFANLNQALADAPGLPLEIQDKESLELWTDTLHGILMALGVLEATGKPLSPFEALVDAAQLATTPNRTNAKDKA